MAATGASSSNPGPNAESGQEPIMQAGGTGNGNSRKLLSAKATHTLGVFLFFLTVLNFYLFLGVWPRPLTKEGKVEAWSGIVAFPGFDAGNVGPEIQLILVVALSGALGGVIHAGFAFTSHVGGGGFERAWVWWSVFRSLLGGTLALVFFFAVRASVLTSDANVDSVNPHGVAAISGLVGMFSREAKDMLQRTFESLFNPRSNKPRDDDNVDGRPNG